MIQERLEKMRENNQEKPQEFDTEDLFQFTMKKNWLEVLRVYDVYPLACEAKLTKSEETALHIAVSSYHADQADATQHAELVSQLVDSIPKEHAAEILALKNDKGDTPLHLAAALGSVRICECIARKDKELINNRNLKGETPLFLAAHHGKMEAFLCLHELYNDSKDEPDESLCRRKDGDTILHSAISGQYFQLANQIISYYPILVNSVNQEGFSPLHILARKPNVFQSSSNLRLCDRLIYRCVIVHEYKKLTFEPLSYKISPCFRSGTYPDNYQTCLNLLSLPWAAFRIIGYLPWAAFRIIASLWKNCVSKRQSNSKTDEENPKKDEESQGKEFKKEDSFPPNYDTCILGFKFMMNIVLIILSIGFWRIGKIKEKKERHKGAVQIMTALIQKESNYKYAHNGRTPTQNVETMYAERFVPPPTPPHDSSAEENTSGKEFEHKEGKNGNRPVKDDDTHGAVAKKNDVKKETPILVAAKMGITEMVEKIRETFPVAIQDLDANEKNALLLALENRQIKVYDLLMKMKLPEFDVKKETPILVAAKMGITEMVEKILETFPVAIQDLDANEKNALLLAVENRQTNVYDLLMKMKLPEFVLYQVDDKGNSAMHLAAMFQQHQPWRISGAALQMQWEIKWYKYVKKTMPPQCFIQYNKKGETASEIFRKTHEKLVKDGSDWLLKTSESCSLVAALIATVAFATSSTVPGGVDEDTGRPVLENQPAFDAFSVTSIVALCFSVTALVFFLAILTSRCQQQDFRYDLPRKLLFALSSLFTSIAAILFSFCAGHFFVLKDQFHGAAIPIYTIACLPISFFAFAQLPLYFDLLWSIIRKVPLRSYKIFYN